MNRRICAAGLVTLGCMQMAGDLTGNLEVKALGLATHASPAPKVFTSKEGFESFSSRFFLEWTDATGAGRSLEITPRSYGGLRGPYNRRNAYGAALAYGPVLEANERTRPILHALMHHSFCGQAPLLRELGIDPGLVRYPLRVRLEPRDPAASSRFKTQFDVTCEESHP